MHNSEQVQSHSEEITPSIVEDTQVNEDKKAANEIPTIGEAKVCPDGQLNGEPDVENHISVNQDQAYTLDSQPQETNNLTEVEAQIDESKQDQSKEEVAIRENTSPGSLVGVQNNSVLENQNLDNEDDFHNNKPVVSEPIVSTMPIPVDDDEVSQSALPKIIPQVEVAQAEVAAPEQSQSGSKSAVNAKKKVNSEMKNFLNLLKKVEEGKARKESNKVSPVPQELIISQPLESSISFQESQQLSSIVEEMNPIIENLPKIFPSSSQKDAQENEESSENQSQKPEKQGMKQLYVISQAEGTQSLDHFECDRSIVDAFERTQSAMEHRNRYGEDSQSFQESSEAGGDFGSQKDLFEDTMNLIREQVKDERSYAVILNQMRSIMESHRSLYDENDSLREKIRQLQHKNDLLERTTAVSKVQIANLSKVAGEYEYLQSELGKMKSLESQLTHSLAEARSMNNNFSEMLRVKAEESQVKEGQSKQIRVIIESLASQIHRFQEGFLDINDGLKQLMIAVIRLLTDSYVENRNLFTQVAESCYLEKDQLYSNQLTTFFQQREIDSKQRSLAGSRANEFISNTQIHHTRSSSSKQIQRRASATPQTQQGRPSLSGLAASSNVRPHQFSNMHNFSASAKQVSTPKGRSNKQDFLSGINNTRRFKE